MKPEEMLARLREKPVALSIRSVWAGAILKLGKNIENRQMRRSYRGPVFIHQSKHYCRAAYEENLLKIREIGCDILDVIEVSAPVMAPTMGHIIGMVEVVDCVTKSDSPWFTGPFGFVLANPVAFAVTVPCKGRLGFFKPDCDLSALRLPEVVP